MINQKFRIFSIEFTGKHIIIAVVILIALLALGLLQAVAGSVFVLFVPGFFMTLALFPPQTNEQPNRRAELVNSSIHKEIDKLERFIISIALSAAIVPIVIMMMNIWFGLLIRVTTIFLYVTFISLFSLFVFFFRTQRFREGLASLILAEISILSIIFLSDITVRIRYIFAVVIVAAGVFFFYKLYKQKRKPIAVRYEEGRKKVKQ